MLQQSGDGYTIFKDCKVVQDNLGTDANMLITYFTDYLNSNIPASLYGNIFGQGRIKPLTSDEPIPVAPTEKPVITVVPSLPTGDHNEAALLLVMMATSFIGTVYLSRKQEDA